MYVLAYVQPQRIPNCSAKRGMSFKHKKPDLEVTIAHPTMWNLETLLGTGYLKGTKVLRCVTITRRQSEYRVFSPIIWERRQCRYLPSPEQ
jgi:hypothetical protein